MVGAQRPCVFTILLLLLTASGATSTVIVVGGSTGWTTGFNYDAWVIAQNIQPRVGDSLVFNNPDSVTHTVGLLTTLDAYERCVVGSALNVNLVPQGSNFTFVIPQALEGATVYAVCTIPGHCLDNQKIKGTVLAALTNGTTPASPPPSPGTNGTTPTSPSPTTTTTDSSDADMNRFICWTTAILLIAACFWNLG